MSSQISPITAQRRSAYDDDTFHYVTTGEDSEQPVGALCGWAAETTKESLLFLILGAGRLMEDQLIYVDTRENLFFMIWDL